MEIATAPVIMWQKCQLSLTNVGMFCLPSTGIELVLYHCLIIITGIIIIFWYVLRMCVVYWKDLFIMQAYQ